MSSTEYVPITRELMHEYYQEHKCPQISEEMINAKKAVEDTIEAIKEEFRHKKSIPDEIVEETPAKTEHNILMTCCCLEEIQLFFGKTKQTELLAQVKTHEADVDSFEKKAKQIDEYCESSITNMLHFKDTTEANSFAMVKTFLPSDSDLRMKAFYKHRQSGIDKYEKDLEKLIEKGCTPREKYDFIWDHEFKKRQHLSSSSNTSGVMKGLVKHVAGVPQVLLDYAKTFNDPNGPMEEYRIEYGPYIKNYTEWARKMKLLANLLCLFCSENAGKTSKGGRINTTIEVLCDSLRVFSESIKPFYDYLFDVNSKAPFFLPKGTEEKQKADGDTKTVTVSKTHTIAVSAKEGDEVSWAFVTDNSIKFSVAFEPKKGKQVNIVPLEMVNSHEEEITGEYVFPDNGQLVLFWDNSFSWLNSKTLTYSVLKYSKKEREKNEKNEKKEKETQK